MAKFHITEEGVGRCRAFIKPCPYDPQEHFTNQKEAQAYFERKNEKFKQRVLSKRTQPATPLVSPFNSEGLTDNMMEFRDDLRQVATMVKTYENYRNTGLDEEDYLPSAPVHLLPYLDDKQAKRALRNLDYEGARRMYVNALKEYYMERIFTAVDIDCLFDDEDIETYAGEPAPH